MREINFWLNFPKRECVVIEIHRTDPSKLSTLGGHGFVVKIEIFIGQQLELRDERNKEGKTSKRFSLSYHITRHDLRPQSSTKTQPHNFT